MKTIIEKKHKLQMNASNFLKWGETSEYEEHKSSRPVNQEGADLT